MSIVILIDSIVIIIRIHIIIIILLSIIIIGNTLATRRREKVTSSINDRDSKLREERSRICGIAPKAEMPMTLVYNAIHPLSPPILPTSLPFPPSPLFLPDTILSCPVTSSLIHHPVIIL
eukprot:TRINITY_DN2126_c2_g2_i1.p1 TRINITY_DN2126_c2_g2~~TRINITY_DN2126_c2_g2_i1.p1  ORF type:complete len:120 (-),score=20.13 TRINITY_DN2126_c2_g2_i1:460-819(-)